MLFKFAKISLWDSDVFSPLKAASVFVWEMMFGQWKHLGAALELGQEVAGYGSALLNYSLFLQNAQDLWHFPLWQENTKSREISVWNLAVTHFVSAFSIETDWLLSDL